MRIAVVHSFYSEAEPSGENVVVEAQVEALRTAGHDVHLVQRHTDDVKNSMFYRARAAKTVAFGHGPHPTQELEQFAPDVVHVHNLFPNFGTSWLDRWDGPIVATLHNFRSICAAATLYRDGATCTLCPDGAPWSAVRYGCYRNSRVASVPLATANGMWGHTVTQLGIAGAILCASRGRWLPAGAWIGLGMLARPHIALIAAVIGLGVAWSRRDPRIALLMAIPTTASLGVLSLWNRIIFGRWSLRGGYEDYVVDVADGPLGGGVSGQVINYIGFLAAADRGVLIWTPVLVLLLPLVATSWKNLPDWVRWLALSGIVYTAAQLQVNVFHGGYAFYGYRHGLELITCLLPACALSVQKAGRAARIGILAVVALQSLAIATGAISEDYFVRSDQIVSVNAFGLALATGPTLLPWSAGAVVLFALAAGILLDQKREGRRRPTESRS